MASSVDDATRRFEKRAHPWRGVAIQATALMTLWLVLSGYFDTFHISLGVVSVIVVLLMNARFSSIRFFPDDRFEWVHFRFEHLGRFIPWLAWEIIQGSLQVASAVLHPKMPIEPAVIRFRAHLPLLGAKVVLGNVITLTPGTVTLSIDGDEFLIHALRRRTASGIIDGTMPKWIARLFRLDEHDLVSNVTILESNKEM